MIAFIIAASFVCLAALAAGTVVLAQRRRGRTQEAVPPPPSMRRPRGLTGANHRESFGARLRAAREGRSVTLAQVAAVTKIKQSIFAGLEGGDMTGWPDGLFRRAFVRQYAKVVGLDADRVVAEFTWVYSDHLSAAPSVERRARPRSEAPRLKLDEGRALWLHDVGVRSLRALADIAIVAFIAGVGASTTGIGFSWLACAAALLCYPVSFIYLGETPAAYGRRWLVARFAPPLPAQSADTSLRLVPPKTRASSERAARGTEEAESARAADQSKALSR